MNIPFLFASLLLIIIPYTLADLPRHFLVEFVPKKGHSKERLRASGSLSDPNETAKVLIEKLHSIEVQHSNDSPLQAAEKHFLVSPLTLKCQLFDAATIIEPEKKLAELFKEKHGAERKGNLEYGTPILSLLQKSGKEDEAAAQKTGKAPAAVKTGEKKGLTLKQGARLSFVVVYRVNQMDINITGFEVTHESTKKVKDVLHEVHFGELDQKIREEIEELALDEDKKQALEAKKEELHRLKLENRERVDIIMKHLTHTHSNSKLRLMNPDGTDGRVLGKDESIKAIIEEYIKQHGVESFEIDGVTYLPVWFVVVENTDRPKNKPPHNPHGKPHEEKVEAVQGGKVDETVAGKVDGRRPGQVAVRGNGANNGEMANDEGHH